MKSKNLAAILAGAFTLAMLSGTSAFADWRHPDATKRDDGSSQQTTRQRDDAQRQGNYDRSQRNGSQRPANFDRTQRSAPAQSSANFDRSQRNESTQRNDSRSYGQSQNYESRSNSANRNDGRRSVSTQGRVTRVEHYRDGYRVWLDRGGYPFFVPAARFRAFPIRVGLSIGLGGYWNPLGYYDVYDVGPYGGGYATAGDLHGLVESVDYRRGTVVLRDDISGSFVTILLRGNDPRLGDLRPGDYVDLNGAWSRAGVFDAFSVADLRGRGYDRYDDRN